MNEICSRIVGFDDFVPCLSTPSGTHMWAEAMGAQVYQTNHGNIIPKDPIIKEPQDVYKLNEANIFSGTAGLALETAKYFTEFSQGKIPIKIPDMETALTIAHQIWDTSDFFISMYENPEEVHYLLSLLNRMIINFIKEFKKNVENLNPVHWPSLWAPSDMGICVSDDTMPMISGELYEEFGLPYINEISKEFGGLFYHCCQINEKDFKNLDNIENLISINFDLGGSAPYEKIKEYFGKKVLITPHNYLRADLSFEDEIGFLDTLFAEGLDNSLYIHICSVMQSKESGLDRPIDPERIKNYFSEKGIHFYK